MKLSKTALIRGALTALGFHLIVWGLVVLVNYLGLIAFSMFFALIARVLLIPVYFKVMGEETAGFGLAFAVLHAVLSLLIWLLLTNVSEAVWDILIPANLFLKTAGYFYAYLIILVAGFVSPAFDGAICLMRKWMKGREF